MANYILKLKNDGIDYTKKDDKLLDYVEIDQNEKTILLDKDGNKSIKLSLHKMSFHRKVYEPGRIDASVQISVDTHDNIPKIQKLHDIFMRKSVQLDADGANIASEYYVHEVRPRYESANSTSMYVDLKIYSIDNLMRINKFSEAYLGRELREYIVKEGIKNYVLKVDTFNEEKKKYSINLSENDDLQNLSYGGEEFIQPYLVQYNETFYDFLARVCNRCGEFMYFENGELHVGLHLDEVTDKNNNKTKYKKLININEDKCNCIDYQNISDGVISVENYSHDSLKHEEFDDAGKLKEEPKNDNSAYNINQINETGAYPETKTTEDGRPTKIYNDEVSNNEFFMPLYRDEFSSGDFYRFVTTKAGSLVVPFLEIFGSLDNILDGINSFATTYTQLLGVENQKGDKARKEGNKIIDTWTSKTDTKMGVPFADNERHRWTTLRYYSDIKYNEKSQEQKMVNVDMGDAFENLRLGDVVTLPYDDDNRYVVIEVWVDSETIFKTTDGKELKNQNSSMCFSAVPLLKTTSTPPAWQKTKIEGCKTLEAKKMLKFFPPLLKSGAFRQSEPQHAIVIDSDDPKNQGRVRVRFPWQRKVEVVDDEKKRILLEAGTPWIRMVTPMATKGGGMYFKPEKGDEVMVDFENGNIERPFVVGALYSKNAVAPMLPDNLYAPKEHRIIKSPNGHYIKFEDAPNLTTMLSFLPVFKFLKQWNIMPSGLNIGDSELITNVYARKIMGGVTISDGMGFSQVDISGHDRKVTVKSTIGDVEISALSGITVSAPMGNVKIEGKNIDIVASNRLTLTSGTNLYKNPLNGNKNLSWFKTEESFFKNEVDRLVGSLIDMSALRGFLEIIIKPVNGALQIKSYSFLALEAGDGNAEIPVNNYSRKYLAHNSTPVAEKLHARGALTDNIEGNSMNMAKAVQALTYIFGEIKKYYGESLSEFIEAYNDACTKLAELAVERNGKKISYFSDGALYITNMDKDRFIYQCFDYESQDFFIDSIHWNPASYRNLDYYISIQHRIENAYRAVRQMIKKSVECTEEATTLGIGKWKAFKEKEWTYDLHEFSPIIKGITAKIKEIDFSGVKPDVIKNGDLPAKKFEYYVTPDFTPKLLVNDDDYFKESLRKVIKDLIPVSGNELNNIILNHDSLNDYKFFKDHGITISTTESITDNDISDTTKWSRYINSLTININEPIKHQILNNGLYKYLNDKSLTFIPENDVWAEGVKGKILMSDGTQTISFKGDGADGVTLQADPNIINTDESKYIESLKHFLKNSF